MHLLRTFAALLLGQPVQHFDAVSGWAHRQNADRHCSGTRAPLPAGRYSLGPVDPGSLGSAGARADLGWD